MNCSCGGDCKTHSYQTKAGWFDVWTCIGCGRELRKLNGQEVNTLMRRAVPSEFLDSRAPHPPEP